MKQLALYKTEDEVVFDYQEVYEHLHTQLTELQSEKVGFVSLFKEDEVFYTTNVEGYSIFKVGISRKKPVKQDNFEREFLSRQKKLSEQGMHVDLDILAEEVNQDLLRMSDITYKGILVVFDHNTGMFMIDASRNDAEDCMKLLHNLYEDASFEVVMSDPKMMQTLLTSYVLKESVMPEPLCLGEYTELGKPVATIGAKATPSKVIVKDEHCACEEVKLHLTKNKRINKLEIDSDGVLYFVVDSTFFINKISFEEALKFKENDELSEEDNLTAHWSVALPEVSKAVGVLLKDLDKKEEE